MKRFRPKVSLDQRKRAVKACSQCHVRKRRCIPVSAESCRYCSNNSLNCRFETIEEPMGRVKGPSLQDVVLRFKEAYPEIGLENRHVSFLFEIFKESREITERGPSERGDGFDEAPEHISQSANLLPPTEEIHGVTGQQPGEHLLPHRRFLAVAAAAAALPERDKPDFPQHAPDLDPADEPFNWIDPDIYQDIQKDFPSPAEAEILISSFFLYADANWYYLDETSFRQRICEIYDGRHSIAFYSPQFLCLTLSVFALGSHFVQLYQTTRADTSELITPSRGDMPGMRYFKHAQKLISHVIRSPSLEGLLSCLLLALHVLPFTSAEACYTYLGLAMRIAISLGLHRKQLHSSLSTTDLEIHNRVFWTVYSIERRASIALRLPELLQAKDIDCPLPQRNPYLDALGSYRAERLFAYTKLTLLLNEVSHLHVSDERSTDAIRRQLLSWEADLPVQLKILDGHHLRLNVHLQLQYSMIWIYIGRAALVDRVRKKLNARHPTKGGLENERESDNLSDACADHAKRIINLIDLLRARGQLCLFSHADFHTCTSATIILLLDSILKPSLVIFPKVRMAMDALRYLATGSAVAKQCLKYVESFQDVVNKALASMYQ